MSSLSILGAVAIFAGPIIAAPATQGGWTVNQVANSNFKANPFSDILRTVQKYGGATPVGLAAAVSSGTVVATPDGSDLDYLCPVNIDGQTVNLDFDTGSSDLWVFSNEQPVTQTQGHTIYDTTKSSNFQRLNGYTWDIQYGDGSSSSGDVGLAPVTIGGLTVQKQAVEIAKNVSAQFIQNDNLDGLLGLSFSSLNTVRPQQQKTWFDNVRPQLALPLVAADLKHLQPGSYDFGYLDSKKYVAPIIYTPVQLSYRRSTNNVGYYGYWNFSSTSYQIGSKAPVKTTRYGIADTGTTLLYLDSDVVSDYYSNVLLAEYVDLLGVYVFPCIDTLPDFSFTPYGSNSKVVVKGKYINYTNLLNIVSATSFLSPVLDALGPVGVCVGGMQPVPAGLPNIYGDIFLKSVYTVFESSSSPRLGFAGKPRN
ncbi:hypothetical protein VTL71DRAFT_1117 [Oculimacula yallundae]|uniref:Peptidase A1 domain-containing protein n=1 Tax=Oculimacula yallundae TaxID=86028 RepID=A0ABR4D4A2_9HELO